MKDDSASSSEASDASSKQEKKSKSKNKSAKPKMTPAIQRDEQTGELPKPGKTSQICTHIKLKRVLIVKLAILLIIGLTEHVNMMIIQINFVHH